MSNKFSSKNNGFSLPEVLVSVLISSIVLVGFYQISFGAVRFFTVAKNQSDNLDTKTPSMELLARYFERAGVSVIQDASGISGFPVDGKKIAIYNNSLTTEVTGYGSSNSGNIVSFYANMGGMGLVKRVTGSNASLLGCRLGDTSMGTNGCFYVRRASDIFPANTTSKNSISFNYSLNTGASECVEDAFFNTTIDSTATASNDTNATVTGAGVISNSGGAFQLNPGDIIFNSPHQVILSVKSNPLDGNKNWLFAKLIPFASSCASNIKESAVAPAESLTVYRPDANTHRVIVTVEFRSKEFKGVSQKFKVTRLFGGQ